MININFLQNMAEKRDDIESVREYESYYLLETKYDDIEVLMSINQTTEHPAFTQLKKQLSEMFQLDRGDLDFGIYRIMNQKREEVTKFLDEQLLPQVQEILKSYQSTDGASAKNELNKLIANLNDAGVDPDTSPKVQELRTKTSQLMDMKAIEIDIYSDLYNFFKRYYSEGDFMSMRRYKEGVYAIPYEGEEVKLHWANHDQYYIKTSENLKNYSFKTLAGKKRVRFEVIAGGTETNNNKAAEGKERRFILHIEAPTEMKDDELIIRFQYRALKDNEKLVDANGKTKTKPQEILNQESFEQLSNLAEATSFGLNEKAPTANKQNRTLLEKHLNDFTAKNSFDYFIHKDLGKFLRQELDFFIKNEIMYLDDIENESAPKVESYLAKIRAMRKVAGKIIQFLAQLEDFQKKLWLKKKFVLETHYCVTLDHIIGSDKAGELLSIIAKNDAQLAEWVKLFAIDEISGFAAPLTIEFLKANDKLLVDTKFFNTDFKYMLLSIFNNLDAQTDGLLINSENFQALSLLQERYKEKVKCIYIDPPYNTGNDDFIYKDSYQSSSWLSMFTDRVKKSYVFLSEDGILACSIDDNEMHRAIFVLDEIFGQENRVANVIVKMSRATGVKMAHEDKKPVKYKEFLLVYAKNKNSTIINPQYIETDEVDTRYSKIINNIDDDCSKWEIKNISQIIKEELFKQKEFTQKELLKFYFDNANKIVRLAANSQDVFLATKGQTYFQKISTSTGLEKYAYDGQKVLFYSGKIKVVSGKKVFAENAGDLWIDVVDKINDLSNEGGVTLQNGKKPEFLLQRIIDMFTNKGDLILDFCLGSGTSCAVALKMGRKWIGIELGSYFEDLTLRRIKNTINGEQRGISKDALWKGGGFFSYSFSEQYEDALDNLELSKSKNQVDLFDQKPHLKEQYMLGYMLEMESRGSQSLLNIDAFDDPFTYKLRITRNDDTQMVNVDLIETFNYLLGLTVRTIDSDKSGIVTITGENSLGEKCLIIWRNVKNNNNAELDDWFSKRYSSLDLEYDAIYVNGDNNIENMKQADDQWKVRLIEAEFSRLMFDVQDI